MRNSESGMATFELIPLMLVFLILVGYTFGFFGVIHSGILQSIHARAYAFEMYRNRANLTHFRGNRVSSNHFKEFGSRSNTVLSEYASLSGDANLYAAERPLSKGLGKPPVNGRDQADLHSSIITTSQQTDYGIRNETLSVSPVWLMIEYGICLNADCETELN